MRISGKYAVNEEDEDQTTILSFVYGILTIILCLYVIILIVITKNISIANRFTTIIIIIIFRLQSSRPQVSSIDGCFEPFPTADCHLAGYQDPPEGNEYSW